ncbi:MAG: hypothetical protein ACYTG6_15580, partial [Planctomycetota bacterium]
MTRSVLLLCALLLAFPVAARSVRAGEDEEDAAVLERAVAGLLSSDAGARSTALGVLEGWVDRDAAACTGAVRRLGDVFKRRPPDEAARAVAILARIPGDAARSWWLRGLDPSVPPVVFRAAVDAAASRQGDPEALKALLDLARDPKHPAPMRALALEALGGMGGGAARFLLCRPPPGALDGDVEHWLIASGRALGLGRMAGREAIPPLLDLLVHPDAAPRVHAWESLVRLTGRPFPAEADPWRTWWAGYGGPVPVVAEEVPQTVAAGDRYTPPPPAHVPHYYGVPIARARSHVVFCLDVSQSMY